MSITFANVDASFELKEAEKIKKWIETVVKGHGKRVGRIAYRFCTDKTMWETNVSFLNHDTFTDIITFDSTSGNIVSGDIIISIDRVVDNAAIFNVSFEKELCRVLIHGVLHLLGFKDKSEPDEALMRKQEDESLLCLAGLFPEISASFNVK